MNWIGAVSFVAGSWLIGVAVLRRRRLVGAGHISPRDGDARLRELHPSLARIRTAFRPFVFIFLVYVGIKTTLAYFLFDASRYFSIFDLAGFLFLLAAYATWVILRMKHLEGG
jgi:hypothetical protein